MRSNEAVDPLSKFRKAGQLLIELQRPRSEWCVSICPKDSVSAGCHATVVIDKHNGFIVLLGGNLGKAVGNFLGRGVVDMVAGLVAPTVDPVATESAVAIENQ